MKKALLGLVVLIGTLSFAAGPVGQSANYKVDKDPKRTHNMIKKGTVVASIPSEGINVSSGENYEAHLKYQFTVALMGDYDGLEKRLIERFYFTPEFLEKLRKDGHYEGKEFKAKHEGYADVKNMDGKSYTHCDKVLLYDLKESSVFSTFLAGSVGDERAEIKDLKALLHVYPGVPVLGGVKIDISGIYNGMNIKVGADYLSALN